MITLPYIFKSTSILVVLLLYYLLFLRKQTFFTWNRIYLLCTLIIAVSFPLIRIPLLPAYDTLSGNKASLYYVSYLLEEVSKSPLSSPGLSFYHFILKHLGTIYLTGIGCFLLYYIHGFLQLRRLLQKFPHKKSGSLHLVWVQGNYPTFSFFHYIFFNDYGLTRENKRKILEHEKIHVFQYHSIDLVLAELVCLFNWFNPLVWILKRFISENHEYLADRQVLRKYRSETYLRLLIGQAFKSSLPLTQGFSCATLKKRIIRMTQRQSRPYVLWIYLPVLWVWGVCFVLFSCYTVADAESLEAVPFRLTGETENAGDFLLSELKTEELKSRSTARFPGLTLVVPVGVSISLQAKTDTKKEKIHTVAEVMPRFKGNVNNWLQSNIRYPAEALEAKQEGKIIVEFTVEKDGSIRYPKIVKSSKYALLDREALRVIRQMPSWEPGMQKGEKVRVKYNLPFSFSLNTP